MEHLSAKNGTAEIVRDFRQNGFTLIPGVLEPNEVKALREKTDVLFVDPEIIKGGYVQRNRILRHTNELDQIFCDLLVREPIYNLMEAIFGKGFQQCGMNVLRTDDTNAIDHWHVDKICSTCCPIMFPATPRALICRCSGSPSRCR